MSTSLEQLTHQYQPLGEWAILHGYRGSIAHGTFIPSDDPDSVDDKDTMSICVPTIEHYFGLRTLGSQGTQEVKWDEWDCVSYECRKAVRLLAQGNPNVLSLLWLPDHLWIKRTDAGLALLTGRDVFVHKGVFNAFVGYAAGQMTKMETSTKLDSATGLGYMGAKRRALVERFGYDVKNASHLIRLLRQCVEFLATGSLTVERPDAAELIAIKRGEWSYERVRAEADQLRGACREALVRADMPAGPDWRAINALCVSVVRYALQERNAGARA